MIFLIRCLLFFPIMLFAKISYSYEEIVSCHVDNSLVIDQMRKTWGELDMPTSAENAKSFRCQVLEWFADSENQDNLLRNIHQQIALGNLESSEDISEMMNLLEKALCQWRDIFGSDEYFREKQTENLSYEFLSCRIRSYKPEVVDEDNIDEYIEYLREEEKTHKDEACELVLQATAEAIAAGGCAASGLEIPALAEGVQASRHFVQGCREYNEGVRYQQEADELERQYRNEDELIEKKWWEIWKK